MRHIITYVLLIAGIACVYAQTAATQFPGQPAIQSHQIMSTGTGYNGTVYAPFDNTVPSEQTIAGTRRNSPAIGRQEETIRKGFIDGPESGQSTEYPIGEPYVLALFALLFSAFIAVRRKAVKP